MHPVTIISTLRRWLTPLHCEFTTRGETVLAFRLRDRMKRETEEFVIDFRHIRSEADLRVMADQIMAKVERTGFRAPAGHIEVKQAPAASAWFRGALQRLRVAG